MRFPELACASRRAPGQMPQTAVIGSDNPWWSQNNAFFWPETEQRALVLASHTGLLSNETLARLVLELGGAIPRACAAFCCQAKPRDVSDNPYPATSLVIQVPNESIYRPNK